MKHKMILDVDPGIDDSLAIMFAAASKEVDLLGCTVVCGNVNVDKGSTNALHALAAVGDRTTGVYVGEDRPLRRAYIAAEDTHGDDGIGGASPGEAPRAIEAAHAVDFILETINDHPGEVDLVALGPLTNVAKAIERDPATIAKLNHLYIMGGTARFHGNCSPVAEYNFWEDPHAADIVMRSSLVDKTMIGLDVTHNVVFTPNLRQIVQLFETPVAQYITDITSFYVAFHWRQERTIGCVINDPLVPVAVLMPEVIRTTRAYVEVVNTGPAVGQSIVDVDGFWHEGATTANVALEVDPKAFFDRFLKTLFPTNGAEIDTLLDKEFGENGRYLS